MKKIICLLLAIGCAFALFSCGEGGVEGFASLIKASQPTVIVTQINENDGDQTFISTFTTTFDGDDFTFEYSTQRYRTHQEGIEEGTTELIKTETGKIYYKNGKYSKDGTTWFSAAPDVVSKQVKLDLKAKNLDYYSISKDGKTLSALLTAEQAELVFGVAIKATGDVELDVESDGKNIRSITIKYATEKLESVLIYTTYSYAKVGGTNAE
ncbi:MAG: hypothetical protein J6V09_07125 [Clostridia bacterium]|nr:hypothetical protein [Clostridia bacterium]